MSRTEAESSGRSRLPGVTPERVVRDVRRLYRETGTPERARGEKAYLKSSLDFHGVTVPRIRATAAALTREHPDLDRASLRRLVDAFFATRFHDLHSTGIALLERRPGLLTVEDLPWLIGLVRRAGNWAHVDWLATKVVGPVVASASPSTRRRLLRAWARDEDLWVRRTALLAQHDELRDGRGDFPLFEEIAAGMLAEREFFIRKAIGWVVREVSKRRPRLAFEFLRRHRGELSGLTFREGSRRLPAALRGRLTVLIAPTGSNR